MRARVLGDVVAALPAPTQPLVTQLAGAADRRGLGLYLVGGPVRDFLLGREVRDVDLVAESEDASALDVFAREALGGGLEITTHERFGTVRIEASDAGLDIAMARCESYAHPGALPRVEAASLEEDLARRDFRVNALAIGLRGSADARVDLVDPGGGLEDLEARRLRLFHDRSFHDDPTRSLRAARLGPRLGFSLARGARRCLRDALRDGAFGRVSGDRLRAEIEKVFGDAPLGLDPVAALSKLDEWHVLGALEPGLALPRETRSPLRSLGRSLAEPPWARQRFRPWASGLFLWLAPLPAALRRRVLRRFGVRGDLAERANRFPKASARWLAQLAKARGRGAADALLGELREDELAALHAQASPGLRRRIVRFAAEDRRAQPPIGGRELKALGLEGPEIGRSLARVRAAFLDGQIVNREEALALAREHGRRRGRKRAP